VVNYDKLQPMALDIGDISGHPLGRYRAYGFPQSWARPLRDSVFTPDEDEEGDAPRGLPLWAVTSAISTLMPQVLTCDARGHSDVAWLAWNMQANGPEPDESLLVECVRGGVMAAAAARNEKAVRRRRRPPIDIEALAAVVEGFRREDLHPEDRELPVNPHQALTSEGFTVLPHMLAIALVSADWRVQYTGWDREQSQERSGCAFGWRRTASRSNGAEMVSWPPHVYVSRNGSRYPWSYVLRLTAQTLPFDPAPRIHVHASMRRWARSPVFDPDRAMGVHLLSPSPWADHTSPFGIASIKWHKGRGGTGGFLDWNDDLVPTLARLAGTTFLPGPRELARDPLAHLEPAASDRNPDAHPVAAVPFRYGLGEKSKHSVGDGVSARDRWRLFTQLADALGGITKPVEPYGKVRVPTRSRPAEESLTRVNPSHLAAATSGRLDLTLLFYSAAIRTELMDATATALGITWTSAERVPSNLSAVIEHTEANGPLTVTVRVERVGSLASALVLDPAITSPKDRAAAATAIRRSEASRRFGPRQEPDKTRMAIVEMADAPSFTADTDPKKAVKAGAWDAGFLTQNVTPPKPLGVGAGQESEATRRNRARSSVRDLLIRQNGLISPPDTLGLTEEPLKDITTVGLWVVRRNSDARAVLPLAVARMPDEPFVRVRIPHIAEWSTMRRALLALGHLDNAGGRVFKAEQVQEFFGEVIEEIGDGSDTAVFTLAQNMRGLCKGLTNDNLIQDVLAFNPASPVPAAKLKGIRHLRLRTSLRGETGQVFAHGDVIGETTVGHAAWLWKDPRHPRRFYSTPGKPNSAGSGSPHGSRIEAHMTKYGPRVDTLADVWNPRLLEITAALVAPGDNAGTWAAVAHQHRYISAHFADPLALPAELHFADKIGEYLLPRGEIERYEETEA
jgi:hypothetical protein